MDLKFFSKKTRVSKIIGLFVTLAAVLFGTERVSAQVSFESGTSCLSPENPNLAVVCGFIRSATPKETYVGMELAAHPNPPVAGASIYIYECDATSPSCKKNGALTNAFSSTYTNEEGFYSITMRKVGNLQIRYLAIVCENKLAGLFKVPSYKSFSLTVPVDCEGTSTYVPPLADFNPVSAGMLSCDIVRPAQAAETTPLALEGTYSPTYAPRPEFNFNLEVEAADSRYAPIGSVFWLDGLLNVSAGPATGYFRYGAFYHEDCKRIYGADNIWCYQSTSRSTDETIEDYTNLLYNDNRFTVMNFLPNIPIRNNLLFFKDLSARQDVVDYVQDPTAPAQLLHTIFSNCKGGVSLRMYGGSVLSETLPTCEDLKACNTFGSEEENLTGSFRNRQYAGGPGRNLASPAILQDETEGYLIGDPELIQTEVCQVGGRKYRIADIQPPWNYCGIGEADCPYLLDKTYWNPEFAYYFGVKSSSAKVGYGFEGSNDSYFTNGVNATPFTQRQEKADIPVKGGTYYTDNNYSLTRNNGLTSALGGIVSDDMSTTSRSLRYVLQRPGDENLNAAIYEEGTVKIEDAGSMLMSFCGYSNTNDQQQEVTAANEASVFINNLFRGNIDHYFTTSQETRNKRTPTSSIFVTTPARNRNIALQPGQSAYATLGRDLYDGLLTASYGDTHYTATNALSTLITQLLGGSLGTRTTKSFFDRQNPYPLENAELRDDLRVTFTLSEQNFEGLFPLPENRSIFPSWGDNTCYPWNAIGTGQHCYQQWGGSAPDGVTRTCKVDLCERVSTGISCYCRVDYDNDGNSSIARICSGDNSLRTESCNVAQTWECAEGSNDTAYGNGIDCGEDNADGSFREWNRACLDFDTVDIPECPSETAAYATYWPIYSSGGPCPESEDDFIGYPGTPGSRSCPIYFGSSDTKTACNFEDAGPFQANCSPTVTKDSNFRATQQLLRPEEDAFDLNLDATKTINNEMWKKFAHPFTSKVYGTLAFVSADTSVGAGTANKTDNKNKDVSGFGGTSPEYKTISAHPLFTNFYEVTTPVNYHCVNPLLGGTGPWNCTLLPVPNPEILDLTALRPTPREPFTMDITADCQDHIGIALSPTFINILNSAATYYGIPAASILVFLDVGWKFDNSLYRHLFSPGGESALIEASAPWYGKVPNCDDADTAAIGAYDWILPHFLDTQVSSALNTLSQGRGDTASRCNFLDATYAVASSLASSAAPDCAGWTWDTELDNGCTAMPGIAILALGVDRQGSYSDTSLAEYWAEKGEMWNACY